LEKLNNNHIALHQDVGTRMLDSIVLLAEIPDVPYSTYSSARHQYLAMNKNTHMTHEIWP
jgi:hypothetical protein